MNRAPLWGALLGLAVGLVSSVALGDGMTVRQKRSAQPVLATCLDREGNRWELYRAALVFGEAPAVEPDTAFDVKSGAVSDKLELTDLVALELPSPALDEEDRLEATVRRAEGVMGPATVRLLARSPEGELFLAGYTQEGSSRRVLVRDCARIDFALL